MKKRTIVATLLLFLLLMAVFFTVTATAADSDFAINDDGELTKYNGTGGDVVIPNGVTSIGKYAFYECKALKSVDISNSVTSIGERAFYECKALKSITIPNSVTSIGEGAFYGCSSLMSVTIPDSVTSIEADLFSMCSSLKSVAVPDSVTLIGPGAFHECSALTSVTIPNGITSIYEHTFTDCSALTSIIIPDSVTHIRNYSFNKCRSLTSVIIGNGISFIGIGAFDACETLKSITIGNHPRIEKWAFRDCRLKDIYYTGTEKHWTVPGDWTYIPSNVAIHYNNNDTSPSVEPSLTFDEQNYTAEVGEEIALSATFLSNNSPADMKWSCSNPGAVTLIGGTSVAGPFPDMETTFYISRQMIGNKAGTYRITLTARGLTATTTLTLTDDSSLTFDKQSYTAKVGETIALSATFLSSHGPTDMQWFCDDTEAVSLVAETSVAGPFPDMETTFYVSHQMVGNKAGTYEITLTASGLTATTTLTITDDAPPNQENAIHLSKNAYSLQADEIGTIVADWKYPHANASTIHWSVSGNAIKESPEAIAEPVFADGSPAPQDSFRFKGVHTGQATITATLPSGESDSCVVTVEDVNPYYLVIIPYSGVSVQEGDKTEIQATVCATDTQRAVDDRELEAVTSIVWESSNGDFVAFDKDGKTREESDHISHGLFGNKADAVKIYGRARGKSEVSCTVQINGYTISKSVTASVNSKETNEMIKLISNWTDAYAKYITALEKYLEKDSEKDNAIPVDEMGKLLMEADFNHPETRLVQFTNSVLNQRAATGTDQLTMRTYVYQGVAQFLADKGSGAFPKIKAKDVSDVFGFASEIATAACNYVDTAPYSCTFYHNGEAVSVKIQGISAGAAHMREILYNDQKVADMISSVDEIMAVLIDYGTKLCELSREVIKQAYKEALKELFSKDISGLMEESVKKRVEDSLGNYIGRFSETGINDVVKDVQYCFDYYGHLKTVFSASASDPKSILDAMGKLNFKSNPANVKDYSVKRAMKSIKKAGSSLEDFLKKAVVKDGGDYGQFLTDVYDIMFHFHCPITIAVYSGDVQVGLLSEDDIWYDSNVVYIEQYGEEKNVYAHSGTALRFEVVGTDEGTLDYIVEEFQDGKSIQRLNYYDINLYEGKTVSISVSGATITEDDAVLSESDGRPIFCDETLTSNDYEVASVLISSLASPRRGGQVQGCGSYVRGDRIALRAIPENGFLFDGWRNDDGELVSLDRVYEFTAREDVSLTAMFAEDAEEISEPDSVAITSATLDKADGLKVCAAIQCPKNVNATVYCAFYKSNGQMVSVEAESLQTGENDLTLPVDDSIIAIAKLFVLDEQFVPQCQCAAIEVS